MLKSDNNCIKNLEPGNPQSTYVIYVCFISIANETVKKIKGEKMCMCKEKISNKYNRFDPAV